MEEEERKREKLETRGRYWWSDFIDGSLLSHQLIMFFFLIWKAYDLTAKGSFLVTTSKAFNVESAQRSKTEKDCW